MKNKGFTLLEVIIAIAIMGISVVMIMQLFSGGLRSGRVSRDYTMAVIHAKEKMEEMLISPAAGAGDFDDSYKWQTEISPYSQVEKGDSKLIKISVKVLWDAPGKDRSVELATLKAAPEEGNK